MQVEHIELDYTPVCVLVDGQCNHADLRVEYLNRVKYTRGEYELEDLDQELPNPMVIQCAHCKAWRYTQEDAWNGITIMPTYHSANAGRMIHDVTKLPF